MCMEYKFFIMSVEAYMERMGVDRTEVIEKFGKLTRLIVEAHLTDVNTGEQHKTWARYEGSKTYEKLMEELADYMIALSK